MQILPKVLREAHCVPSDTLYRLNAVVCGDHVWYNVSVNYRIVKEFKTKDEATEYFEEVSYRSND